MSPKSKFDPRKMMEKAVKVMQQSINEPRSDDKSSPLVGAVLLKSDGAIETAYRGELRHGDHAEYTLLERKHRDERLDGCVLFATLEPCAPGARKHPKLSCTERIVLARITEVWVGIEDPDPTVDRKGIKYLQDNGVTVHMFDRDLQEEIRRINKKFIKQAEKRAIIAKKQTRTFPLSSLEDSMKIADIRDFDEDALKQYRAIAKLPDSVSSKAFQQRLLQQGLMKEEGDKLIPTGFGLLLFGKAPRDLMPQAGLLGTIHYPNGKEELRNFEGPQVFAPGQAIQWLKDKLPNTIERTEAKRKETNEGLFELVREGIVNALVHRNYEIKGAKCQLVVTPDTIVIKSPGKTIEPITLEQMQSFNAPMLSRNPALHYVFARMEMAEERGLGLNSMKNSAVQMGLPLPKYNWEAPYLVLTLYRSSEGVVRNLRLEILERLNSDEKMAWQLVLSRQSATSPEVMKETGFDERKAQRILKKLHDVGLVRRIGKGRATRYNVIRP